MVNFYRQLSVVAIVALACIAPAQVFAQKPLQQKAPSRQEIQKIKRDAVATATKTHRAAGERAKKNLKDSLALAKKNKSKTGVKSAHEVYNASLKKANEQFKFDLQQAKKK